MIKVRRSLIVGRRRPAAAAPPARPLDPLSPRALDLLEVRRTLYQAHSLMGRLLSSTAVIEESDFDQVAEVYLALCADYELLVSLFSKVVPLARLEAFLQRVEAVRRQVAGGAGAS